MDYFTGLSFIICYHDKDDIRPTLSSIRESFAKLNTNDVNYEIITVRGNHPSLQRNNAVNFARYSHLYFLDNDSIVNHESLEYIASKLNSSEGKKIAIIGGPALLPSQASNFEFCIDGLLGSYSVVGRRSARYSRKGKEIITSGSELILCNMVINKRCFIEIGRFDYRLYPNEENEFIYRVYNSQGHILYSPMINVERHQRKSYIAFIQQMINYGRGKAEELKIELSQIQLFGLRVFCLLFLVLLLTLLVSFLMNSDIIPYKKDDLGIFVDNIGEWLQHIVLWYFIYLVWVTIRTSAIKKKILYDTPILLFLLHACYGFGFSYYLYKRYFFSKKKLFWFKITSRTDDVR